MTVYDISDKDTETADKEAVTEESYDAVTEDDSEADSPKVKPIQAGKHDPILLRSNLLKSYNFIEKIQHIQLTYRFIVF